MHAVFQKVKATLHPGIGNILLVNWHNDVLLLEDVNLTRPLANAFVGDLRTNQRKQLMSRMMP